MDLEKPKPKQYTHQDENTVGAVSYLKEMAVEQEEIMSYSSHFIYRCFGLFVFVFLKQGSSV